MFDAKSRYADSRLETLTIALDDGRIVSYKKPRTLPQYGPGDFAPDATAAAGERLDQFAARVLGDPEIVWRLLDANEVMDPFALDASWPRVWRMPKDRG